MQLLKKFQRDTSKLHLPEVIGTGLSIDDEGALWGWVELPARSTDELNSMDLVQLTSDGATDLRRLIPPGAEFHFKIQWGLHSGDSYRAQMTRSHARLTEGQRAYIEHGARRIEDNQYPQRQVLLGVRFDNNSGMKVKETAQRVTGIKRTVVDARNSLREHMARIRSWQDRMRESSFEAVPARAEQLAWALGRDLHRTVTWLPSGDTLTGGQMARLRSAHVRPHGASCVAISGPDGSTRYVRILVPSETGFPANELDLPGGEWLKNLSIADLDHETAGNTGPIDVSIRGRNIPNVEAKKMLKDALAMAKDQERSAAKGSAGDPISEVEDASLVLPRRMREISKGYVGMVEDCPSWVIEADSIEELDQRETTVIDFYGNLGIDIWAPPAIQDLLWMQTVLGDRRRVKEFDQLRPWGTLVGAWFHGGSVVGAADGPFLAGNIGSTPGPFTNRLSNAQIEGDPVTTVYVGQSGSGKSTGLALSMLAEVILGAWGFLCDIKGDLGGICTAAELYGVPVTHVSTSSAASGSLCPFRYIPDIEEAASAAVDNLSMMIDPKTHAGVEAHLRRAANRVVAYDPSKKVRSTHAVIRELLVDHHPDAQAIGSDLVELSKDPLTRPVAGEPDLTARQLSGKPGLVYMRFDNLRWPGKATARVDWKPGHRLSMMLLQAGLAYAMYVAARIKGLPKVVAFTELHRYAGYDFGRDAVADLALMGRANDVNQLLDTQETGVLLRIPGLVDQISQVHAFKVKTNDEADAQAILLGLHPEPLVRQRQKSWAKGQCLTRDRWNRIAPIHFDYLITEIQDALKTTPDRDPDTAEDVDDGYDDAVHDEPAAANDRAMEGAVT